MPDPDRKTISATQASALLDTNPYMTKWMLYQWLIGEGIEQEQDSRMSWGLKLQPLVLAQAAEDLRLETTANDEDIYIRAAQFGATRDAEIVCPDRGPGALETKCVFDYGIWMRSWEGGKRPPPHYEIQLQIQMFVGDGATPYNWGCIAAWVCGEMHYFERELDGEIIERLVSAAIEMRQRVEDKDEPDPFGAEIELPWITQKWPHVERKTRDLTDTTKENRDLAEVAVMYEWATKERKSFEKMEKGYKSTLIALAEDHDTVHLPGVYINVKKSTSAEKIITEDQVGKVARKASTRTTLSISKVEEKEEEIETTPLMG